jgi:hypothetical protein
MYFVLDQHVQNIVEFVIIVLLVSIIIAVG